MERGILPAVHRHPAGRVNSASRDARDPPTRMSALLRNATRQGSALLRNHALRHFPLVQLNPQAVNLDHRIGRR